MTSARERGGDSPPDHGGEWKDSDNAESSSSSEDSGTEEDCSEETGSEEEARTGDSAEEGESGSDDDDESESDNSEPDKTGSTVSETKIPNSTVDYSSDNSDGQSEKCPICLMRFADQEVASPESCDHTFCLDCLLAWAKHVTTCPVDRQPFRLVLVRKSFDSEVIRKIPCDSQDSQDDDDTDDVMEITYCEVCGQSDREDRMLLCDGCDLGYHLECLSPPLTSVPIAEWFCNDCRPHPTHIYSLDDRELDNLLDNNPNLELHSITRRTSGRLLPRTQQSERIRAVIGRQRQCRNEVNNELLTDVIDAVARGLSGEPHLILTSPRRVKRTRRKRTVKRRKAKTVKGKRKIRKKTKTTAGTGKRKTRKKRRKLKTGKRKVFKKRKVIPPQKTTTV